MNATSRTTISFLLLFFIAVLVLGLFQISNALVALKHRKAAAQQQTASSPPNNSPLPRETKAESAALPANPPGEPGAPEVPPGEKFDATPPNELRLADDADSKQGAFWLEQKFIVSPDAAQGPAERDLIHFYAAVNPQTLSGLRVTLRSGTVVLEKIADKHTEILKQAPAKIESLQEQSLGILWRRGELSVWNGPREVLAWRPAAALTLSDPSAVEVAAGGVRLGLRQTVPLTAVHFDDDFMGDVTNGSWRPLAGHWEVTTLAFPERSANPFSLRFGTGDKLNEGREKQPDYGLGVIISIFEGTFHIARITAGSPAARAGLAEDDIFIEVEGQRVENMHPAQAYNMLTRGGDQDVHVTVYRPGEKKLRQFTIARDTFKWGTLSVGTLVPPELPMAQSGPAESALIVAGEPGWSDYAAEVAVKPLGSGGLGLAVGVLSPKDYVVFRWRGPIGRKERQPNQISDEKLELVRVENGRETVLAERPAKYQPYEFYRLGVDWNGDKVTCSVDGNEVLSASIPGLKRGQIGLYALRGETIYFDDVHVSTERANLNAAHVPERKINQIFAFEDDMEVWANPALEWERGLKTGWAMHKARFPGEQAIVITKPKYSDLAVKFLCKSPDEASPELRVKDGMAKLVVPGCGEKTLSLDKKQIEKIVIRGGSRIEVEIDGKKLGLAGPNGGPAPDSPHWGDRIAIRGLKNLGEPASVRATSSNTLEYTFNTSPVDWKVESGRWGLLNKWICDPRWSWFGGRTKTLGALWNKYEFSGDVTVDAHVALMMQREDPPYERPGDYNITICGDGVNLDSGYTLIFGGDNNSWTRLYRKGKLVKESQLEAHRIFSDRIRHPDKPDLHQRWFHLKLEKLGNEITFFRDDVAAFTFTDPEPLAIGRIAFWTVDNGFLLSRVRIAHGGLKPAPFESRRSDLFEDPQVINIFDGEVFTHVDAVTLPQEIQASLDSPTALFKVADGIAPAPAGPAQGNAATGYHVTNATGGGPFALQWKQVQIDLDERSVVRFAYCIEPGANVDLYMFDLSANESRGFNPRNYGAYRWRMTGPKESNEFAPLVGEIPDIKSDGMWHTVQFDLNPSWRAMWQCRGFMRPRRYVMRAMIGNIDNSGYLLAGINGNHAGAAYSISKIKSLTPADVANGVPKVSKVVWPFDAEGDGQSIQIAFDSAGAGILDESLQVTFNGAAVPRELTVFDHLTQTLKLDLSKMGLPALGDKQQMELSLLGFQNRARVASAGGYKVLREYRIDEALNANKTPPAPALAIHAGTVGDRVSGSAPLSLSEIAPVGPIVARLEESGDAPPWAPPGQKHSIHVVNMTDGSGFGFQMNNIHYDLTRWQYIEMEYKVPHEMPFNLHLFDQGRSMHALLLTDVGDERDPFSGDISSRFGPPRDFIDDGAWHRTTIPVYRLFQAANPGYGVAVITELSLHDNGWRGNRRGMEYWIHNIRPVPAARAEDLSFIWRGSDITGTADFASSIDDKEDSNPGEKKEIALGEPVAAAIQQNNLKLRDGWNYIHVRTRNGAGVWSAAAHRKFFLDRTPPRIVRTEPSDGANFAGQTLKIFLGEENGIDLASLQLAVNGTAINAGTSGVSFDYEANAIVYNAMQSGALWPVGSKVSVEVTHLQDIPGNSIAQPFKFSFNEIKSPAQKGPAIAQIRFVTASENTGEHRQMEMESSFGLNFEEHFGHVHAIKDCKFEWLDDPAQSAFGRRAVRFTALEDDADVQIMLHKNPWWLDRMPQLHFDYKCDPGMKVDLLVEVMGQWHSIQFTGNGSPPTDGQSLGKMEAVVADGTWRHASADLRAMIDKSIHGLPIRLVNQIILSANGQDGCKRGSAIVLDNIDLCPASGAGSHVEWNAQSPLGIAGYSFIVDRSESTIPPLTINQAAGMAALQEEPGVWYAHVRACDQAGNWGETRTIRIDLGR